MALPIGDLPLRGIPPDKALHTPKFETHHTPKQCSFTTHYYTSPTTNTQESFSLNTFHLLDSSIVQTNHPDLETLFNSLQKQLNHHVHPSNFVHPSYISHKYTSHTHAATAAPHLPSLNNFQQFENTTMLSQTSLKLPSPKSTAITQIDLDVSSARKIYNQNTLQSLMILPNKKGEPFIHLRTKKNSPLTTRMLFPKTNLPHTLISPAYPIMPVFKNRLHRTNAIRKLFEDVQIENLTHENAQILHQRLFSMALKPLLPGYHLDDGPDLEAMQKDLTVHRNHLEDELSAEKTLSAEGKALKDKNFIEIVEIARSLLPDEMILDINLPVTSLLGLSHQEAISLIKNYFENNNIHKTPQYYKKRDTTFYLNEIFGILDYIHSTKLQHSSSPTKPPIVTPLPSSPSKRRRTDTIDSAQDLDFDMGEDISNLLREENESDNLLIDELGLLTWDDVHTMPAENLRRYLVAYSNHKSYPVSDSFIHNNDLDDMRETLIIYIIEHLYEYSSSGIFGNSTDDYIEQMDPIWAYFEYYKMYLADQDNSDVSLVLLLELSEVLNELKSARDNLALMNTYDEGDLDADFNACDQTQNNINNTSPSPFKDIHMYYPGFDENATIDEKHKTTNTMFINTIQYHKDNLSTDSEDFDRDITSIIGIMSADEIEMISEQAVCFLLRCYHRLGGDNFPLEHFSTRDIMSNRSELNEIRQNVNQMRTHKGVMTNITLSNLTKRSLHFVSKETGQIILHNHYRNTTNHFRNTFGHSTKEILDELKRLVKANLKISKKKKNDANNIPDNSPNNAPKANETQTTQESSSVESLPITQEASSPVTATDPLNATTTPSEPFSTTNAANTPEPSSSTISSSKTPHIPITSSTTDEMIEKLSRDNAVSEYFNIIKKSQPSLTMDSVLQLSQQDILSKLKQARDDMKLNQRSSLTQYFLTASTTDAAIEKLNVAQCIFALTKYCEERNVVPDDAYMRSLTKHQLLIEVTKARDVLNGVSFSKNKSKPNPPSAPTSRKQKTKRVTKKELAQNLYGVDADQLDPHAENNTKQDPRAPPKPLKDDDEGSTGHKAMESIRDIYTIHAKLEIGSNNFHTPTLVRNLIMNIRKGDPLVQIVPVLSKTAKPSEILENEDALPDDENALKKWVENIRTDKTKLYFTMKIRTVNIDHVKTAVYGWCKGKSHWVDFTTLASIKIFNGGWFHNIHPFYYNRDHFTDYILQELPHLEGKLDIYQKKVFKKNDKNEKIATMAIVIDGDFDIKDEVFDFLYSHKWDGRYKDVSFVPYKSNSNFTKEDQIKLMVSNNVYQKKLARLIIKVKDADVQHDLNGEHLSFQDWLFETTIGGKELIQGVEVAPDDVVRVLFHESDAEAVKDAIHNLYPHVVETFGNDLASNMIDETSLKRAKSSSDVEKDYTKRLKEKTGNPQGPDDLSSYSQPQQQRPRGYFGTNLEVAQGNQTQTSEITHEQDNANEEDLRSQIKAIAAAQSRLESSMSSTISSAVTNTVNSQLAPIRNEVSSIKQSQNDIGSFINIMKNYVESSDRRFESIQNSFLALGVPAQTPSEAKNSPPGVRS